jgi:hypothetical protein
VSKVLKLTATVNLNGLDFVRRSFFHIMQNTPGSFSSNTAEDTRTFREVGPEILDIDLHTN